jgi:hypothetical protein
MSRAIPAKGAVFSSNNLGHQKFGGLLLRKCPPSSLPATMVCVLFLDFDCAGGGRPAILAGIGHVAEVRID